MKLSKSICVYKIRVSALDFINYTYLVIDQITNEAFLIDPAWDYKLILEKMKDCGAILKGILLTHAHYDHINLVESFLNDDNSIQIYISAIESKFYHFHCKNLNLLYDNDFIGIGGLYIQCIHAPGHTKGSFLYLIENHLFTGDTIFIEGCGICSCVGGDADEMYRTVQMVKKLPLDVIVWPGHSFGKSTGVELREIVENNIYFLLERKEFINFRNRKNQAKLMDFK